MIEQLESLEDDPEELFRQAARQLVADGDFHRLFDLRLLQGRHELGLAADLGTQLAELDEPHAAQLEQVYLDACREVGRLFLEAGQPRTAWNYLRPSGDKITIQQWLSHVVPNEQNADELIELALHDAIDPERGYAWLLAKYGTCQAVSAMEAIQGHLSIADQTACAAVLVRHVHQELLANFQRHLQELGHQTDSSASLGDLVARHSQVLAEGAIHIDVSHLAATVRAARILTDQALMATAAELAEYGSHLAEDHRYPEPPPFEDTYAAHRLLFRAQLGQEVDAALEHFRQFASQEADGLHGTAAIETYLILLQRVGRPQQALNEYAALVPAECVLSGYAPRLLDLAKQSNQWDEYFAICVQRNDVLGLAAGKLAARQAPTG